MKGLLASREGGCAASGIPRFVDRNLRGLLFLIAIGWGSYAAGVPQVAIGGFALATFMAPMLHMGVFVVFGGAVLVLGLALPERAAQALELAVGVMLVALGADVLHRLWRERVHFHVHRHAGGVAHFHAHSHPGERAPHDPERHDHQHPRGFPARALLVGVVHGMAGSAALILFSLEAAGSVPWGLACIAIFGAGSILGMAALSLAIAVPLRLTSTRRTRVYGGLSAAVGIATVLLGCHIVVRIGLALAA